MDANTTLDFSQEDIARLTPADQREIQTFVQSKEQEANINRTIHELAEVCFKKCIRGSPSGGPLNSKEQTCMTNCAERFMDSNLAVLRQLEMLRARQ